MALKHTISAACVAIMALPFAASAENHASADTVVATVNGTDITLAHMIVLKQRLPAQYQSLPAEVLFDGILDQLVQQTLLGQADVELSPESVATLENEERALFASEKIQQISDAAVTDEALQAAYDGIYGAAEPETEYNASHILVETAEAAEALIAELNEGAEFALLAQEHSTGPSGPNGGQLGWFGLGRMVPPFEAAVVEMEVGTVSQEPVQTQFGFHVIRLNETRLTEIPPLDAVRGELADQIQRDAIDAEIATLTEGAEVTRMTPEEVDPALLDDLSLLGD